MVQKGGIAVCIWGVFFARFTALQQKTIYCLTPRLDKIIFNSHFIVVFYHVPPNLMDKKNSCHTKKLNFFVVSYKQSLKARKCVSLLVCIVGCLLPLCSFRQVSSMLFLVATGALPLTLLLNAVTFSKLDCPPAFPFHFQLVDNTLFYGRRSKRLAHLPRSP